MIRFRTMLALAAAVLAGTAGSARADFEVQFSYNGVTITLDQTTGVTTVSGGASIAGAIIDYSVPGSITVTNLTVSDKGTSGGFKVTATTSDSNSPGSINVATIDLESLKIKNQTGVAGSSSLSVTAGDTGFTMPSGAPAPVVSTISVTASGANQATAGVSFTSYVDSTNAQFGTQQAMQTINLSPIAAGTSAMQNVYAGANVTNTPYSITQVATFTLGNGDAFTDGSSGTTVLAPAPGGLILALAGMPALGIGAWVCRRVQRVVPTAL
ncbi:MAG TPA: hypothetical protein VH092_37305 [Urbifossiella sp.]|nr:hypothetical protein [Urbifossiella sp.]